MPSAECFKGVRITSRVKDYSGEQCVRLLVRLPLVSVKDNESEMQTNDSSSPTGDNQRREKENLRINPKPLAHRNKPGTGEIVRGLELLQVDEWAYPSPNPTTILFGCLQLAKLEENG